MADEIQWRQLGSIVNTVLLDARAKAVRNGAMPKPVRRSVPMVAPQSVANLAREESGNGFLRKPAESMPVEQLELPFDLGDIRPATPRIARSRARLM
ncbi:hypothetical protein T281_14060 [Rhodomicrobium udaipurense JA643]|uniref:Uncharacterized protein n=1 Tax=Rhodomicrobium udaipurense TaxID=1202716 RepID=A0A8I1GB36_9HYPH|nr:hypothetical protein [Rhodomicrobium udaipurense]KAI93885.1 hypothetical protein T281_14060 [Rhodomicrobium udaipurense JA643]MBJ7543812.1 hypothetical protein [Rhodomicrobium udaipurense]